MLGAGCQTPVQPPTPHPGKRAAEALLGVRGVHDGFTAHLGLGFVSAPISNVSKFKARGLRDRLHKDWGWIASGRVVGVGGGGESDILSDAPGFCFL